MVLFFSSLLADLVAVGVLILTSMYLYVKYVYLHWKRKNIHYVKPSFPFGNIKDLIFQNKSFGELFYDLYFQLQGHKYAGVFQFYKPTLVVRDPELIKNIMIKSFENFNDHGFYFNEKADPLSAHLFLLSGTRWRNLRTKLSPTFTSGKMKMMFSTLTNCGEELRTYLKTLDSNEDGIEIKDLLSRYSTDIIASCAFGIDSNCLKNEESEFRKYGRKIFQQTPLQLVRNLFIAFNPVISDLLEIPQMSKDLTQYFLNLVKETIDYRENNNVTRNDFMQLLIQLKNKGFVDPDRLSANQRPTEDEAVEHTKLTFNEIAAQAFVFFAAGFETSATTMTFCLYELAHHPHIQNKVRDDIRTVLKKHDGKVTYEAVQEMEYLDKVVSETLRLHPPLPILNRKCTKDYTIEETGDFIEKGTSIVMPIRAIQRDSKYYPNPLLFNPEHFEEEAVRNRPAFTYMPFGEGPRLCIGQRFGLMQVKVGLISVLRDNEITMNPKTSTPLRLDPKSFITSPSGGIWLNISRID